MNSANGRLCSYRKEKGGSLPTDKETAPECTVQGKSQVQTRAHVQHCLLTKGEVRMYVYIYLYWHKETLDDTQEISKSLPVGSRGKQVEMGVK